LAPVTYTRDLERGIIAGLHKYGDYALWHQALQTRAQQPYFTSPKARGWEDHLHWLVTKDHVYGVINGYRADALRRPASPRALESWQQPAPEPVPPEDLQVILSGYRYRRS
jgi:hypothetical protein